MNNYKTYKITLWDDHLQRMFSLNLIAVDEHFAQLEVSDLYRDCFIVKIEEINE